MRNNYRNHEHYYDPTAGAAIENISREQKRVNKKPRKTPPDRRRYRHAEHHKE